MLLVAGALIGGDVALRHVPTPEPAAAEQVEAVPMDVPIAVAPPDPQPEPVVPLRISLPALRVSAEVVPIAAADGVLTPPRDPDVLGWWKDGALTGADRGSSLLTGHTVHSGGGALDDIEDLARGDAITITGGGARLHYRVDSVEVLTKEELADEAEELFDQESDPRLVLITCEDWNGKGYDSNVVVTAYRI